LSIAGLQYQDQFSRLSPPGAAGSPCEIGDPGNRHQARPPDQTMGAPPSVRRPRSPPGPEALDVGLDADGRQILLDRCAMRGWGSVSVA
jgi:hypothetical protein